MGKYIRAINNQVFYDGEVIVTCKTDDQAQTVAALMDEAEEAIEEYAASARASAAKLAHAHSGARKLVVAARNAEVARWRFVDLALDMERAMRRARTAARAWKRAARKQRSRTRMWIRTARASWAEAESFKARIRTLIAAGGATADELRTLVE